MSALQAHLAAALAAVFLALGTVTLGIAALVAVLLALAAALEVFRFLLRREAARRTRRT